DEKAQIDAVLIPSVMDELRTGKVRNGRHSVEKILTATGASAGNQLATLLAEPIPGYAAVAELLGRVGDDVAREKGGAALVKRAFSMHPVPDAMWKSLGVVGGASVVTFLQGQIGSGVKDVALPAVRALQQRRDPSLLPYALKIAGDGKADPGLRDEMFGVVESIGGPQAKGGLVHIIETDPKEMVRYRAFESLLTVAKQDGIIAGLEAFPPSATYKRVDVDDLLVKLCEKLGAPARPVLVAALQSKAPLARMAAVMTLEQIGKSPDAPALEKIGKDTTMIKGFPAGETIGKAALRAAGIVRNKN
ncbi:MAG TPA: HEAT repeat domain-containing protein, partial [Polyangia bacterium]|nr:HEAT repeat domain-containing protein [Polyangia bacterium]